MLSYAMVVAGMLAAAAPPQAELSIRNVRACDGRYGPERKSLEFQRCERAGFRFLITGLSRGPDGSVQFTGAAELTGLDGVPLRSIKKDFRTRPYFSGEVPHFIGLTMPAEGQPGEYVLTHTITDKRTGQSASFSRKLVLKSAEFAVTPPLFFYDTDENLPAPNGGVVGQALYFHFSVVGLSTIQGRARVRIDVDLLDAQGREVLGRVLVGYERAVEALVKDRFTDAHVGNPLLLMRPGDFTLRVRATDLNANETVTQRMPLHVTAP